MNVKTIKPLIMNAGKWIIIPLVQEKNLFLGGILKQTLLRKVFPWLRKYFTMTDALKPG